MTSFVVDLDIGVSIGFKGDGFVELNKKFLPASISKGGSGNDGTSQGQSGATSSGKNEEISIVMFVQTRQENGLILWQGSSIDGDDYLSVEGKQRE